MSRSDNKTPPQKNVNTVTLLFRKSVTPEAVHRFDYGRRGLWPWMQMLNRDFLSCWRRRRRILVGKIPGKTISPCIKIVLRIFCD